MTPIELRILKANRKIQIMEEIHKLHMELFELQSDEVLFEHRALTEFMDSDDIINDFILDDPPQVKNKRKKKKPTTPKRRNRPTIAVSRNLFNNQPFESIKAHTL